MHAGFAGKVNSFHFAFLLRVREVKVNVSTFSDCKDFSARSMLASARNLEHDGLKNYYSPIGKYDKFGLKNYYYPIWEI